MGGLPFLGVLLVRGVIHLDAPDEEATALARKLGCRVLGVIRKSGEARVHVELPGWRAVHAVTRAAIYDGLRFETGQLRSDIRQIQKPR